MRPSKLIVMVACWTCLACSQRTVSDTGDSDANTDSTMSGEVSSSAGDGDGDSTGDGDGDSTGDGDGDSTGDGDGDGDGDSTGDGDGDSTGDGDGEAGDGDGDSACGEAGDGDGTGDGDGDMPPLCDDADIYEFNDVAEQSTPLAWDNQTPFSSWLRITAYLCPGEGDWYLISAGALEHPERYLHLDAIVEGSSWCGGSCMDPVLPPAPENTIAIDVYRAADMVQINEGISDRGRINMHGSGENYACDFLVHVYSPTPDASWEYDLSVDVRDYDGEDECEC